MASKFSPTHLNMTKSVMLSVDASLIIVIHPSNSHMVIDNISEATFEKLPFVANSPLFAAYTGIHEVEFFINGNLKPTVILGASDICQGRFKAEDSLAYLSGKSTFTPFIEGFEDGLNPRDMLVLLSKLSADVANLTYKDLVKYRITMKTH